MKTSRRIIKNMLSLSAAEAASKGIQFVYTVYLARILTPDGFGVFGWANAYAVYFVLIVNLGFSALGTREIAKKPECMPKYVNSIVTIRVFLAILSYVFLFFSAMHLAETEQAMYVVWIAGINLFSNAILLDFVYFGVEKMEILALRQVITGILNLIGIFLFVHSKEHIELAMVVVVISTALNSLWMLLVYLKLYGKIKIEKDIKYMIELIKTSVPIGMTYFFGQLMNNLSLFLLGVLCVSEQEGFIETGYYNAAFKIYLFTMIPSTIVQNAFFPLISRVKTEEEKRKTMHKYTMLQFMFGAFIATAFYTFSDYLVLEVFEKAYIESVPIFKILMITCVIVYLNVTFTSPLIGWGQEKKVFKALLAGGIVSIMANVILISYLQAMGAAYATIFSEGAVAIGLSYLFFKAVKKLYLLNMLKFLIFSAAACLAGYYLMQYGLHPIVSGVISFIIYIIINMLFKTVTISELKGYLAK